MSITRAAGWYADPITVGAGRYWDGDAWTVRVTYAGTSFDSPVPLDQVEAAATAADAAVVRRYLDDAVSRGLLDRPVADDLLADLDRRTAAPPAAAERPSVVEPTAPIPAEPFHAPPRPWRPPAPSPPLVAAPVAAPQPTDEEQGPASVLRPTRPSVVSTWWARARSALVTDLAVHGLAYLGVLLLFAGVFGLLYYSGDMRPAWRLVADVAAPTALFGAGWFLRRRGASTVGEALTLLGGVVLPLVAIASVTDGSSVPPDLGGLTLPLVQAAVCLAIAAVYGAVARRHPTTVLRFVVAPVAWLAVGVAVGVTRDPIPTGQAVAQASAMQLAAIVAAVAVTMLVIDVMHRQGTLAAATKAVAFPFAAVAYGVELIVAGGEGWPLDSTLVAATGAAIVVHSTRWLPITARSAGEVMVVAVALARSAQTSMVSWVAVIALAGLLVADATSARSPDEMNARRLRLAAVAASVAVASLDPYAGLVAFVMASLWLLWDRITERDGLSFADPFGAVPGAAMLGVLVESALAWDPERVAAVAAVVAVVVAVTRWRSAFLRRDPLWAWWPAVAGAVALVTTAVAAAEESHGEWSSLSAFTVTAVAVAVAASGLPVAARSWFAAALTSAAVLAWCSVLGLSSAVQAVAIAVAALGAVVVGVAVRARWASHIGWFGHVVGATLAPALAAPWSPAFATSVALATAGWLVAAVAHERGEARHVEALAHWAAPFGEGVGGWVDGVPAVMAFISVVLTTSAVADASGWVAVSSPWAAVVASGAALLTVLVVRLVPWRRGRPLVLGWCGLVITVAASAAVVSFADEEPWPLALSLVCATLVSVTPRIIPVLMQWSGWALSIGVALATANALGLGRAGIGLVVTGWGGAMLVGACSVERALGGSADLPTEFRTKAARAPALQGAIAVFVGSTVAVVHQSPQIVGWTSFGVACVLLAVALLRPYAPLVVLAIAGYTTAWCLVPTWRPFEHPWSLVVVTTLLLVGAALLRSSSARDMSGRWDLPLFWGAHGTALVAIAGSALHGSRTLILGGLAVLALLIAVALVNPVWWVLGAALALAAAASAGLGWLALVLAVEGAAVTGLAVRSARRNPLLAMLGVLLELAAWGTFVAWRQWEPGTVALVTAPATAAMALAGVVVLVRSTALRWIAAVWSIAMAVVSVSTVAWLFDDLDVGRLAGGLVAAASLALLAIAAGVSTPVAGRVMPWLSMAAVWGSLASALYGLEAGPVLIVVLGSGTALAISTGMLLLQFLHPTEWRWPVAALVVGVQVGAAGALGDVHSSTTGLVVLVLVALAVEAAAMALFLDVEWLFLASPVLSCAAWLVYAVEVAGTEPLWLVVPAGVTVLIEAGIVRWVLHGRGRSATGAGVAALELLGMALVVGGFLGRMLDGSLWYSLGAIAAGTALAAWGAITKVRRRALFGIAADLATVVLLVGIPLSTITPDWTGVTLWLVVAGVGALAIIVAAFVERGRVAVRRWMDAVDEVTEEWERIGGVDPQQRARFSAESAPVVVERHILDDAREHQHH